MAGERCTRTRGTHAQELRRPYRTCAPASRHNVNALGPSRRGGRREPGEVNLVRVRA